MDVGRRSRCRGIRGMAVHPIKTTGVAVRQLTKAVSRIELEKLQAVYDNNETSHWASLPIGVDLNTYRSKMAQAYYVLLLADSKVIGYLLLVKTRIELDAGRLIGWTAAHSYVSQQMRNIGLMRRVYDLIVSKGRMISAPVTTPQGVALWVGRIKTDNRHSYVVLTGKGKSRQFVPVDAHTIDNMKRTIWDGDPHTLLVCFQKNDNRMLRLIKRQNNSTS